MKNKCYISDKSDKIDQKRFNEPIIVPIVQEDVAIKKKLTKKISTDN